MWRLNKNASIERHYRGAIVRLDGKSYCLPEVFICCIEKYSRNEIILPLADEQDFLVKLVNLGILTKLEST